MQFHLEAAELKLLADVLLAQDSQQCSELLSKVMAHNLRFDSIELEQTAELLAARKRTLKEQITAQQDAARKSELEREFALLERVLERVNEACVMF